MNTFWIHRMKQHIIQRMQKREMMQPPTREQEAVAGTDNRDIETEHTYHRHGNIRCFIRAIVGYTIT